MSGFTNSDGSALVGGLKSGVGQGILLDASGNVLVSLGAGPGSATGSPAITEDALRTRMRNGQGFSASSGYLTQGGTAGFLSIALFNAAANSKTIALYGIEIANLNTFSSVDLLKVTANPALGTTLTPMNSLFGGAASSLPAGAVTDTAASISYPGAATLIRTISRQEGSSIDVLVNGELLILPVGSAFGVQVVAFIGANKQFTVTFKWVEY